MMALIGTLCLLGQTPLLNLDTIPLSSGHAHVFVAHADADATADVFVLEGSRLSWHSGAASYPERSLTFAEGTSAFDVADVDADGQPDLVAINGAQVVRYDLAGDLPAREPAIMFEVDSLFARAGGDPFPRVLVGGSSELAILLPTERALAAYRIDGAEAGSYPPQTAAPVDSAPLPMPTPFMTWPVAPSQAAPATAIEMRVSLLSRHNIALPDDLNPASDHMIEYRRGTPSQVREAVDLPPERWPWFPIRLDRPESLCALYAASESTIVRVRSYATALDPAEHEYRIGPPRRYPGFIVLPRGDLPDFNGDEYVDLLLWSSPDPGVGIDSFTRAALDGRWPLRLAAHLFSPAKGRYEPRAAGVIECKIPVGWFLRMGAGVPMRNVVLRDFDGDGKTDCAFNTSPTEFCVWRYDDGFAAEPTERHALGAPADRVEFKADLSGQQCTSVALRSARALHVLYAAK
ncbi:MAG: hypothetical protein GY851_09825 [bacterium]|nr:hypothetical protein [bacterium]